jgi:hypothetical protein
MDNDPSEISESSKAAMIVLHVYSVESELLNIPARSSDLNPIIKNIFHIVKSNLREEAINKHIEAEKFLTISGKTCMTYCALNGIPYDVSDKTIASLSKHVDL